MRLNIYMSETVYALGVMLCVVIVIILTVAVMHYVILYSKACNIFIVSKIGIIAVNKECFLISACRKIILGSNYK